MIKVPPESVLGEGLLPGLQTATFSLYPHVMVERHGAPISSSGKGTNPIMGAPTLMTSSKVHELPKAPPPNTITLRLQHMNLGGHKHSVHNRPQRQRMGRKICCHGTDFLGQQHLASTMCRCSAHTQVVPSRARALFLCTFMSLLPSPMGFHVWNVVWV